MKSKKLSPLILLLALLAGCAAPTPQLPTLTSVPPTNTSALTKAQAPAKVTVTATATCPSNAHDPEGCYTFPTETLIPTVTPYPPLSTNGPYFAYLRKTEKQATIVFLDADLVGRKEVLLPDDISHQMYNLNNLSPDGKWLAYYKGSPNDFRYPESLPPQSTYDLSLNLLNLDTGESTLVTLLLSKDFPNNFQKQADVFSNSTIPVELQNSTENVALELYRSFVNGINSLAWSLDGRYLAFAGQMNGLSSDLYVYDMESQTIRQLSSGSEEIQWISWSPDGKGILHGSTYVVGMGMECRSYIADLDGTSVRYLSKTINCIQPKDWIDGITYLEYDSQNVIGSYHLRSVDTRTGGITTYWDGAFEAYSVDLENRQIALNAFTDTLPLPTDGFTRGLYLIDIASRKQIRLLDGMWFPKYFGLGERRFVILTDETGEKNRFLKADGTLAPMESNYEIILVAPDQQHWVGINEEIFVFTADDILVREIALPKNLDSRNTVEMVTWSPDSSGFFFRRWRSGFNSREYSRLYFVNLINGDPVLIENDWWPGYGSPYKWIPTHL